jgi:DNA-binding GntR family transcriptional regulator
MTDRPGRPQLEYIRVANALAVRIESGTLAPGSKLAPEEALAAEFEVAYGTIRRAMVVLRERGLVTTIWGKGTFVSEGE